MGWRSCSSRVPIAATHFAASATLFAAASLLLLDGPVLQVALAGQAFAYLVAGSRTGSPVLTIAGGVIGAPVLVWLGFDLYYNATALGALGDLFGQ